MLTCAACGNTWSPASGASCPACLARGRGRDADGKLLPDPRWFSPHAPRSSGFQAWTEALRRPRFRKPKEEKHKYCKRCAEEITVGDQRSFCAPCLVEQHRDRATARYYRLKAESRCPYCLAPVSRSVVCCEDCKAKRRARPTTDRDRRMMKLSRKKLNATLKALGLCCYCLAPNTTQYLGCQDCLTYRCELHRLVRARRAALQDVGAASRATVRASGGCRPQDVGGGVESGDSAGASALGYKKRATALDRDPNPWAESSG